MPARSVAQQQFAGADLARKRAGKQTRSGMTEEALREFASTAHRGLPRRKGSKAVRALQRQR